jgi:hypothetical protein
VSHSLENKTPMQLRIQAAATGKGMSLADLGAACQKAAPRVAGLSASTMRKVGDTLPATVDKLEVIADVTGAPVQYLRWGWAAVDPKPADEIKAILEVIRAAEAIAGLSEGSDGQQSRASQAPDETAG